MCEPVKQVSFSIVQSGVDIHQLNIFSKVCIHHSSMICHIIIGKISILIAIVILIVIILILSQIIPAVTVSP